MDKNLNLALITRLVDKFSGPAKKMGVVTNKLTQNLSKTNDQWKKHKALTKKFDDLKRQNKAFDETNNKLLLASKRLDKLKKAKKGNNGATKRLTQSIGKQHREIAKLNTKLGLQKTKLWGVKKELHSAGIPYANMAKAQRKLGIETGRLNTKLAKQQKLAALSAKMSAKWQKVKRGARYGAGAGLVAGGVLGTAYARQENAEINLKISALDKFGKVPDILRKVSDKAEIIGNELPGTGADFFKAAQALKQQGVSLKTILNGGLEGTSKLAVILERQPEYMAQMISKAREGWGLKDNQLMQGADLIQRTAFSGVTPEQIQEALSKYGAKTASMGITGIANAEKILAMQSLAGKASLEGEFGVSMKSLLTRSALFKDTINKKAFEGIKEILEKNKAMPEFYSKKGEFLGLDNMTIQLEKIAKSLSSEDRTVVFNKLFTEQGEKLASFLGMAGLKSLKTEIKSMRSQADIELRIKAKTDGFASHLEALMGSLTSLAAATFKPIGEWLKPLLEWSNELVGRMTQLVKGGNLLVPVIAGLGGAFIAWRSAMLTARVGLGLLTGGLPGATGAFVKHFSWIKKGGSIMKWLATRSIPLLLTTLKGVAAFFLANPIGLAIGTLATGAYLVYKNWDKLNKWWASWTWKDVGELLFNTAFKIQTKWQKFITWWDNIKLSEVFVTVHIDAIKWALEKGQKFVNWWNNIKLKSLVPNIKMPNFSGLGKKWNSFKRDISQGFNRGEAKARMKNKRYYKLKSGMSKLTAGAMVAAVSTSAMAGKTTAPKMVSPAVKIAEPAKRRSKSPVVMTDNSRLTVNITAPAGIDEKGVAKMVVEGIKKEKWKAKQSAKSSYTDED